MEYCAKVDTRNLQASELQCLTGLILNVELLDAGKPTKMENEFDDIEVGPDGQLLVRNARYNTRLRPSKQVRVDSSSAGLLMVDAHCRPLSCWRPRTDAVS